MDANMIKKTSEVTLSREKYLAVVRLLDVFCYDQKPGDHLRGGVESCFKNHNDALDREDYVEALIQARKCEDIRIAWISEQRDRDEAQAQFD
jgi:hypothetical protein